MAPVLKPKITAIVPIHGPNRKPPSNAIGEPNPKNGKTHNIVKIKKNKNNKKDVGTLSRYSERLLVT